MKENIKNKKFTIVAMEQGTEQDHKLVHGERKDLREGQAIKIPEPAEAFMA